MSHIKKQIYMIRSAVFMTETDDLNVERISLFMMAELLHEQSAIFSTPKCRRVVRSRHTR